MKTFFERYRPHPWHGLALHADDPELLNAYVEITPFDAMKWEIDKETGYLRLDRPHRSASLPPTPYGFVPRTYCGERVARLAGVSRGDGDPLDICVISERPIDRSDVLLRARPVGGLLMIDDGEADDKVIAVLDRDPLWDAVRELSELPEALVERLRHYFLTYKFSPQEGAQPVSIARVYGAEQARAVVAASADDYAARFGS